MNPKDMSINSLIKDAFKQHYDEIMDESDITPEEHYLFIQACRTQFPALPPPKTDIETWHAVREPR